MLATFSSCFLLLLLLKLYFFLLFPPAAAAPAPATPSVQNAPPGWENTMAGKDGKASEMRPKTP